MNIMHTPMGITDLPAPRLTSLTTVVPEHSLDQVTIREFMREHFGAQKPKLIEHLLPVFDHAGVERRYSTQPLEWHGENIGWKERNALYEKNALDLIHKAATQCLEEAHIAADEVDAIVTVSTTGIATPSLDARLMGLMPFRRNVNRLPLFGLGCGGGVLGLSHAAALARSRPGSRVLLVIVELCTLTFRSEDISKSNIVSTALFGDGAAAALISTNADDEGPAITAWGEHCWPDSLDIMGWSVEDDGLGVILSRDIPSLLRNSFGPILEEFLENCGITQEDVDAYALHPGGAKVLEAWKEVLNVDPEAVQWSRDVLRDYGNMSAPTALFSLKRILEQSDSERILTTALGPGFTAGLVLLERNKA
ncbi:MAG: type III polyketide synthase [Magnetospiraceae bacterium]